MRSFYIGLLCLAAIPVAAQEFEAGIGPTIHERCHMLSCGYATITESKLVASLPDGELHKIYAVGWSTGYRDRQDDRDPYSFPPITTSAKQPYVFEVFCSKVRPIIFFQDGSRWQAAPLRPGDEQAVFGATESAYQDYWGACHHFFPKSAGDDLVATMARRLGYHFRGGFPDGEGMESKLQPSDLLK